jgi:hypothetical protein
MKEFINFVVECFNSLRGLTKGMKIHEPKCLESRVSEISTNERKKNANHGNEIKVVIDIAKLYKTRNQEFCFNSKQL